jgi:hypothetical protein
LEKTIVFSGLLIIIKTITREGGAMKELFKSRTSDLIHPFHECDFYAAAESACFIE